MTSRPPENEAERLRILHEYRVLDTEPEPWFDDVAGVAAALCGTPVALVSFVDDSRQWFKAALGLGVAEAPREIAFCAHTILERDVLVVPDAQKDARFAGNPMVTGDPGIRFYAGAPLISAEGYAVGTIAVVDFTPRELSPRQIDALQILARQVVSQLELRRRVALSQDHAKAVEVDFRIAAERHRAMFDAAPDAIVTVDAAGRVTEFNPAAEQLFGYTRAEALGQDMAALIIPEEFREAHARGMSRHLATGKVVILGTRVEVTAMRRDGTRFPAELNVQRLDDGTEVNFAGFIRDVSIQKELTAALQASAQQYERQRDATTAMIQDERLYYGELSEALRRITQAVATTMGVERVSVWHYKHEEHRLRCLNLYELSADRFSQGAELLAAAVPAYFAAMREGEVIAADDAQRDPRTREFARSYLVPLGITSMLDARVHLQGSLYGVLCLEHVGAMRTWTPPEVTFAVAAANLVSLAIEGSQRRAAEQDLIVKTQILTAVSESLAAYVERGDWPQAFARLLRCALDLTESEWGFIGVVTGPGLRVLAAEGVDAELVNREFAGLALASDAMSRKEIVISNEPVRLRAESGLPPTACFLAAPIHGHAEVTGVIALANRKGGYGSDEGARIAALVHQAGGLAANFQQRERARAQDDERKQLEAQLRQAQKLEAVGQLAGGVAHDFSNILTVIDGHASLLLADPNQPVDARASLRLISETVGRASALIGQLLAFSKKRTLQAVEVDMNAIVANMMRLLQRVLGEHIALRIEPSPSPVFVRADTSMMEQVITNLVINARDAMPHGGLLTLSTHLDTFDAARRGADQEVHEGAFVRVRIADTGTGIPEDVLPHIFEPFYTTKGQERGTGLGLAMVNSVVKQHHGWIAVSSEVNRGTTFDVYLPVVPAPLLPVVELADEEAVRGGHETVMVVEDDTEVREVARLFLQGCGYHVIEAESGRAALRLWHARPRRIDLVLTDMVMPEGIAGTELAAQLLADDAQVAVIITSGYSIDTDGVAGADSGRLGFLAKPYTSRQLARAVRDALDSATARAETPVTRRPRPS